MTKILPNRAVIESLMKQTIANAHRGSYLEGIRSARELLGEVGLDCKDAHATEALNIAAFCFSSRGQLPQASVVALEAFDIAKLNRDISSQVRALTTYAQISRICKLEGVAVVAVREAIRIARDLELTTTNRTILARAHNVLASAFGDFGYFESAAEELDTAKTLVKAETNAKYHAVLIANTGNLFRKIGEAELSQNESQKARGNFVEAARLVLEARNQSIQLGELRDAGEMAWILSEIKLLQMDLQSAQDYAQSAISNAVLFENPRLHVESLLVQAECFCRANDLESAEEKIVLAADLAKSNDLPALEFAANNLHADLAKRRGDDHAEKIAKARMNTLKADIDEQNARCSKLALSEWRRRLIRLAG